MLIILLFIFSIRTSIKINHKTYNFKKIFCSFKNESKLGLFLSLGTKIGVGSIIGTTACIFIGGSGSIFWMLFFTLITSPLIYLEVIYAYKHKEKIDNINASGPYYIIKNGLKNKYLGILTGLILIIAYSFLFLMVQTNTISFIILLNINISKFLILIILLFILFLTLIFNMKELLKLMNYLVPIMCFIFVLFSFGIIFYNIKEVFLIFKNIFLEAFKIKSFFVGFIVGIKRSIFLNELLIGTTSSTSIVSTKDPIKTGLMQVFGSYFITFGVGLLNSILVILYLNNNNKIVNNYNELINNVFIYHLGSFGSLVLIVLLLLFGLTTIISGIYIGLSNLKNMINNKYIILIFKIFVILFCCIGLYINVNLMWDLIDFFLLLLLCINSIVLYKISGDNNDR